MKRKTLLSLAAGSLWLAACTAGNPQPAPQPIPVTMVAAVASPEPTKTPRVAIRADVTPGPRIQVFPDKEDPTNPANMTVTETRQLLDALPKVGALAPDFSLHAMDDSTVALSTLRGHPIIINFWASWCVACRAEAPELQATYEQYKSRGLVILGVDDAHTDPLDRAQAYVEEFKLTFPILLDEQGAVDDLYRVPGLPTTFFVDADGVIRNLILGQIDKEDIRQGLELIKTW